MRSTQTGLGWLGSLIVLAMAIGAGYYAYQALVVGDDTPSCAAAQTACLQNCRRSSSDNASAQACQEACRREAQVCANLER